MPGELKMSKGTIIFLLRNFKNRNLGEPIFQLPQEFHVSDNIVAKKKSAKYVDPKLMTPHK